MCKENVKEVEKRINIQTAVSLDLNKINQLKENAMLKVNFDTWIYWDFEKNDELGYDIWKMTKGSGKKVWWYCSICDDSYPQAINKKIIGRGCSICKGYYTTIKNSFGGKCPDIAKEWHPTKNGELTPYDVSYGSGRKVWWRCGNNPFHEWEATPHNRGNGTNCPYCIHNPKTLSGFNDLQTTHPNIAEILINKDLAKKISYGSSIEVDWKCQDCLHINRCYIYDLVNNCKCKKCSDNVSLGEKIVYSLLEHLVTDFKYDKEENWSNGKRYDFICGIPNDSHQEIFIIETHGIQHYEQSNRGKRTLEEEQANDKYKYEMAITNGIKPENYIVIDCRYSDFEFIKNNILNSRLAMLYDLSDVDWINLDVRLNKFTTKVWEMWNKGYGVMQISEILKLSKGAIKRYLKSGNSLGVCNYDVNKRYERMSKKVFKIDISGNILDIFKSLKDARDCGERFSFIKYPFEKNIKSGSLALFIYEDDYICFRDELDAFLNNRIKKNTICQLEKDSGLLICKFNCIQEVVDKFNFSFSNIYACLKNKAKSSYGYKWMFLEDYEELLKNQNKIS